MFAGGWSGMGLIDDLDRGVMDRFLVAPTSRGAIMLGRVTPQVLTILIQTLIIVGLALLVGGRFGGGVAGAVMLIVVSTLLSIGVASLSNGVALLLRKEESVIAAVNMVPAAADLPVVGVPAAEPGAAVDPGHRPLQPGQLGHRGGPHGAHQRRLRRAGVIAHALSAGLRGRLHVPCHARLPLLPALGLKGDRDAVAARR